MRRETPRRRAGGRSSRSAAARRRPGRRGGPLLPLGEGGAERRMRGPTPDELGDRMMTARFPHPRPFSRREKGARSPACGHSYPLRVGHQAISLSRRRRGGGAIPPASPCKDDSPRARRLFSRRDCRAYVTRCGRPGATMRAMRVIGQRRMAHKKGKGGRVTVNPIGVDETGAALQPFAGRGGDRRRFNSIAVVRRAHPRAVPDRQSRTAGGLRISSDCARALVAVLYANG